MLHAQVLDMYAAEIREDVRTAGVAVFRPFDDGVRQQIQSRLKEDGIYYDSKKDDSWKKLARNASGMEFPFLSTDKVHYYYLTYPSQFIPCKDTHRGVPVAYGCVAIFAHPDGMVTKGYSYCSLKDNFRKAAARGLALSRLLKAYEEHQDFLMPICRSKAPGIPVEAVYHAEFRTVPTQEELSILGIDRKGEKTR